MPFLPPLGSSVRRPANARMRPSGVIATIAPRGARDSIEQLLGELLQIGIEREARAAAVAQRRLVVTVDALDLVELEIDRRVLDRLVCERCDFGIVALSCASSGAAFDLSP